MIIRYKKYVFKQLPDPVYDNKGDYVGRWKFMHQGTVKYFKTMNEVRDYLDIITFNEKLEVLLEER